MAKEFKDWIDEFVENGANPKNVVKWPEEAGGTRVVNELPQVGEEHTIYELHTTTPSKFNYVTCHDKVRYVFENEEAFRDFVMNVANHYNNHNEFYCYCLAEDELIRVYYNSGSANWTLLDKEEENVFIDNNERLCICKAIIDEYTALLLNGKQVPIGDSNGILYTPVLIHQVKSKVLCDEYKLGLVFPIMNSTPPSCVDGVPSVLFMSYNVAFFCADINSGIVQWVMNDGSIKVALPYVDGKYRYDKTEQYFFDSKTGGYYTGEFEWVNIEDFNFKEYVDYETYDTIPLSEGRMDKPFIFDPSGKPIISYWIFTKGKWVNADEIREFKSQEKTVSPSTNIQQITPDEGYSGLSKVTINALNLQDKTAYVENGTQFITCDDGFDGLREVVVKPVKLQKKTVRPTTHKQFVRPDTFYTGLSEVTVDSVTYGIDSNIKAENIKKDVTILGITGTYEGNGEMITYTVSQLPNNSFTRSLYNMSTAQVGDNIYLFGGLDENASGTRDIYKFDPETETITELSTTLPETLENMGTSSIGSNIYLFGGFSSFYGISNSIYKFDTETETLTKLTTTLPQKMYSMGTVQVGSNIYLFGGRTSSERLDIIYKFDTKTETLTTLTTTLPKVLNSMGVAIIGNNIYLFGGFNSSYSDTIYKFNIKTETITTLTAKLPQGLSDMAVGQIGSNVYLLGGGNGEHLDTIYKFDTETETISTLSITLPITLSSMGSGQIGSNIYLFSGATSSDSYGFHGIYKFKVNF